MVVTSRLVFATATGVVTTSGAASIVSTGITARGSASVRTTGLRATLIFDNYLFFLQYWTIIEVFFDISTLVCLIVFIHIHINAVQERQVHKLLLPVGIVNRQGLVQTKG